MALRDITRRIRAVIVMLVAFTALGCAGYSASVRDAQIDLLAGRTEAALQVINEQLDLERPEDIPRDLRRNRVLLLLERATLLQAIGEYELSARDMMAVDQRMEWLDLDGDKSVDLAKYLYSASATPYRAPAYERLLLNTINMINFLALGNMQGAKVEARRFNLLESFFGDYSSSGDALVPQLLAVGNYLGGVAFESARDYDIAARYYARAWAHGFQPAWFREQLTDLFRVTGSRVRPEQVDALAELIDAARTQGPLSAADYRAQHIAHNAVIVVQTGLVPQKVAERWPIGAAVGFATQHRRQSLTSAQVVEVNRLAVSGALKWVNFPRLSEERLPGAAVTVYDNAQPLPYALAADVDEQVRVAWNDGAGGLINTAILRMLTRAVAGGATAAGGQAIAKSEDKPAIGVLGWLAGVAVEGAMTAADVPDTRSWSTLPATIYIARQRLAPGEHQFRVDVGSATESRSVQLSDDRVQVLNFSRNR